MLRFRSKVWRVQRYVMLEELAGQTLTLLLDPCNNLITRRKLCLQLLGGILLQFANLLELRSNPKPETRNVFSRCSLTTLGQEAAR